MIRILNAIISPFLTYSQQIARAEEIEKWKKIQENATTYQEWEKASSELDILEENEEWKKQNKSEFYDYNLIEQRLNTLRELSASKDTRALINTLRADLRRKIGNIGDANLYKITHIGTKHLIEDYVQEVCQHLESICELDNELSFGTDPFENLQNKYNFFSETRQAFGRSALLLSGGASFGCYHFGLIKALLEANLLPRVIAGSSVGSLIAAILGVSKDEELKTRLFEPGYLKFEEVFSQRGESGAWKRKIVRLFSKGVLMDIKMLEECVKSTLGDITFKEAYDRTGRVLNITIASTSKFELPHILNYLTAPNVLIWSAACASCALWLLYEPVELLAKDHVGNIHRYHPSGIKWTDGSMQNDLPMVRLAELFNVNFFIVSQVNPHVVPFLRNENFSGLFDKLRYFVQSEFIHRFTQIAELGLLPKFFVGLQPLISQKYEGDITIVPKITLEDYSHVLSNPNEEFRLKCTQTAERSTWLKISQIKINCLIEQTLEHCVHKLHNKLNDSRSALV